jgi:RNA polymerase sigma-70 factor (ECF subfamily)
VCENDESLIAEAVAGNQDALVELLRRHGDAARRAVTGKIAARWQSVLNEDDVVQQTYADAFLAIDRLRPRGVDSFRSWLATLTRNNLLDAVKHLSAARSGGKQQHAQPASDESFQRLWTTLAASTSTPSLRARRSESQRILRQAVDRLPKSYRQVVIHYDLEDRTADEVAAIADCSVGAMFMRRARAHTMLADILGDDVRA